MKKLIPLLVILVIVGLPVGYAVHLVRNYLAIQKELSENEARQVVLRTDENSQVETGYIYAMRRDTQIRDKNLNLVWFIVVPSTNDHWSCSYQYGYSRFRVGDSVQIVRQKNADQTLDYTGYILGQFLQEKGKVTNAWILDLDELEAEDPGE